MNDYDVFDDPNDHTLVKTLDLYGGNTLQCTPYWITLKIRDK